MAASNSYNLPSHAVWFITGCSSGIGQALSILVAQHKTNRLVATARNTSALAYLPDTPNVLKLTLDVTSQDSVDAAITATLQLWGRIDVVVNNAGFNIQGDAEAIPDAEARRLVETNFWGTVMVTRHAVRVMREENPRGANGTGGGVIMNVTSMGGRIGFPGNSFYHASKFAVEGFIESVSKEVRPEWNIHFCLIEPGGVKTNYATSMKTVPPLPAYAAPDTPARMLEAYVANPESSKAWAEASAVAETMFGVVSGGQDIPLRVPLGSDSWSVLKAQQEQAGKDLEKVKELSLSVSKANM
ncbi:short-chain dehydrogenase [Thelonectria olida]|uniref:Short-chain dehydrogenase n=1 Tax=Thelonectria olida TaxID=1576542 RepID=A0A9P8VPC3_9HYPO|nr:short-chain dehydrogenase [Thelonectria olida]